MRDSSRAAKKTVGTLRIISDETSPTSNSILSDTFFCDTCLLSKIYLLLRVFRTQAVDVHINVGCAAKSLSEIDLLYGRISNAVQDGSADHEDVVPVESSQLVPAPFFERFNRLLFVVVLNFNVFDLVPLGQSFHNIVLRLNQAIRCILCIVLESLVIVTSNMSVQMIEWPHARCLDRLSYPSIFVPKVLE